MNEILKIYIKNSQTSPLKTIHTHTHAVSIKFEWEAHMSTTADCM